MRVTIIRTEKHSPKRRHCIASLYQIHQTLICYADVVVSLHPSLSSKDTCFENYSVSRTTRSVEIDMQNFQEVYVISNGLILLR